MTNKKYEDGKLEEKSKSSFTGYSLVSAADAMGYTGRVFKTRSPLPPSLELTCGNLEVFMKDIWPKRK